MSSPPCCSSFATRRVCAVIPFFFVSLWRCSFYAIATLPNHNPVCSCMAQFLMGDKGCGFKYATTLSALHFLVCGTAMKLAQGQKEKSSKKLPLQGAAQATDGCWAMPFVTQLPNECLAGSGRAGEGRPSGPGLGLIPFQMELPCQAWAEWPAWQLHMSKRRAEGGAADSPSPFPTSLCCSPHYFYHSGQRVHR